MHWSEELAEWIAKTTARIVLIFLAVVVLAVALGFTLGVVIG